VGQDKEETTKHLIILFNYFNSAWRQYRIGIWNVGFFKSWTCPSRFAGSSPEAKPYEGSQRGRVRDETARHM